MKNVIKLVLLFIASAVVFTGCASDAYVASKNLSKAADMFEVERRIVFYNGITDKYMLTIQGRCSIEVDVNSDQLEVTCKIGETVGPDGKKVNEFKKHYLGLSDNVTYIVEHLETTNVSEYRTRVIFKPESLIPNIDFETSITE